MEKIKLLLYCTKQKPYLIGRKDTPYKYYLDKGGKDSNMDARDFIHNGKIVAECDFEVEEIKHQGIGLVDLYETSLSEEDLCYLSCLTDKELHAYFKGKNGYAIHIKNLNIFDKPRELSDYDVVVFDDTFVGWHLGKIKKAPQNMMKIITHQNEDVSAKWIPGPSIRVDYGFREYCLISIRPEWLCKILNGEKTIEIRKKVLKEMINNV